MDKEKADKLIVKFSSKVYGFAVKKSFSYDEAEKLSNYKDKLQAGTYILNTSMTADEMMAILARENIAGQPEQAPADSDSQTEGES